MGIWGLLAQQRCNCAFHAANLDLHDIARSSFTYGLTDFFVAHPIAAQRELALRVRDHWVSGSGAKRIPDRKPPMEILRIVESLDAALAELGDAEIWVTSANRASGSVDFSAARERIRGEGSPILIVFGTGWGLHSQILDRAAVRLESIESPRADGYNHLSVRAAAAIVFDRLLANAPR